MKNPIKFFLSKEETETKVANNRLLSYATGLAGQNMNYNFVSNRLFVFMNTVLKIPDTSTGWITFISTLWDAINDPIVGTIVDSRNFKPGHKMRPLILYTSPIIGVLTALMFADFHMSTTANIIYIVICYLLIDLLYSFQDVALWGLLPLSSPNSDERARVSQWVTIGAGAGSTVGGLFPILYSLLTGSGMSEKNVYLLGACVLGLGGMMISMLAYRMKEKVYYKPEKKNSVIENLKSLRYNRTLIIICLARFFGFISLSLPWEYFFYTKGVSYNFFGAEISGGTMMTIYSMVPGIPGALAMFFATPIAKKIGGMKRILVLAEIFQIICRLSAFAIGANGRYLNTGTILCVMAIVSVMNIPISMKDIAHRSLTSDSIDEVELKTGERTEGIAFSMQNFISKLGAAVTKLIQGYVLKFLRFDNNIAHPENVSIIAMQQGRFVKYRWHQFMLGPLIGSALYLITILFLKDDRAHVAEVERLLQEKREKEAVTATEN